ncbi:MAG: GTPase RsgA [Acidimicrobiales bacterium]
MADDLQDDPELARWGWAARWSQRWDAWRASDAATDVEGAEPGRVVRHDGAGLVVATRHGAVRAMFAATISPAPVVGDWVVLDRNPSPVATLTRDSLLRRRAAGKHEREQPLVANVDLVLVVCGLDRPVRGGRIQRTVAIAVDAGAESLVVLTKADKVGPEVAAAAAEAARKWTRPWTW